MDASVTFERKPPFRGSAPFLAISVPASLPLRHFAFAAASLWLFCAGLFLWASRLVGFEFEAYRALGLVHVLTLGWITMTIFGVMTHLPPALWQTPLAWPRAAAAAWWGFAGGIVVFIGLLWAGSSAYWIPALAIATSVALYLACFLRTGSRVGRLDFATGHVAAALIYFGLAATVAVFMALDRHRGIWLRDPDGGLIAHIHLALIGWFSLTIIGISYRMIPSIALTRSRSWLSGWLMTISANAGLLGLAADGLWGGRRHMPLWGSLLAGAYVLYLWQARGAKEVRKPDPSFAFTMLALAGGAVWAALGWGLATGRIEDSLEARSAYVFAALVGWVTPFILGQIQRMLPFMVWLHVYSPRDWTPPIRTPKLEDLFDERRAWAVFALWAVGTAAGTAGFWLGSAALLRAGGAFLLAAATLHLINAASLLRHLIRPDPRWDSYPGRTVA
jgi:hypothetical protein